MNAEMNADE